MKCQEGLDIDIKTHPFSSMPCRMTPNVFSYRSEICSLERDAASARANTFQQVKYVVREGMYGRDADNN